MQLPNVVPTFRDDTVTLDGHVPEDLGPHLEGEDEETARRLGWWPQRSTEETVRAAFQRWAAEWRSCGPTRAFAVRDSVTRCLVGGCELRIQPDDTGHVSYWTNAQSRKKGYATHALGLLCRYAVSIGVARLEAHVATDNYASRRVAEGAGFEAQDLFTDKHGQVMVRYSRVLPRAEDVSVTARQRPGDAGSVAAPWHAWRMKDLVTLLRRSAVTIVGAVILVVGVVLLVAPGPGLLVILLALAVFAVEYEWARRHLHTVRTHALSAAEKAAASRVAKASAVLFGVGAIGLGGVLIFTDVLPLSGAGTGAGVAIGGLTVLATMAYSIREVRRTENADENDGAERVGAGEDPDERTGTPMLEAPPREGHEARDSDEGAD